MKFFRIASIMGAACILIIGCSEQKAVDTSQIEKNKKQAAVEEAKKASEKPKEVDGILTYTEKGLAIVTESDLYLVMGQDLSGMVGQKVKITGTIAKVEESQVIQVMSVMPIK